MVCCSLPEARPLYDSGRIRALGVMAPQRVPDFEQTPTFREQGTDWVLGGWRAVAVPRGTPDAIQQRLRQALLQVVQGESRVGGLSFPDFMEQSGFDHSWRTGDELREFLSQTDAKLGDLLTSEAMRTVNRDRFQPLAFPLALAAMLGLTLAGLAIQAMRRPARGSATQACRQRSRWGWGNFALIVVGVLTYVLCVETVGFVLMGFLLMLTLTYRLGARWQTALAVALVFSVTVYQLFAHLLRVPLPRGWLGW